MRDVLSETASVEEPALVSAGVQFLGGTAGDAAPVLQLSAIEKHFGPVHALKAVSLELFAGEVLGLVGENGAGKSTLMSVAAGSLMPDSGTVTIAGHRMDGSDPEASRRAGLAIVYQDPALIPDLRVDENCYLGVAEEHRPRFGGLAAWSRKLTASFSSESPLPPAVPVRDLQPDKRFVLEISKALAGNPKVVILDEPTEHLSKEDVEILMANVRQLAKQGCAVVYISHRIHEVKTIADRIAVLRDGAIQDVFPAGQKTDREIVNMVAGKQLAALFPEKQIFSDDRQTAVEIQNFVGENFSVDSLALHRGEIVGLAGIEGQGQRDFLRALAGLGKARGRFSVGEGEVPLGKPWKAAEHGVAFVPNDRHGEGIFTSLPILANLTARTLPKFSRASIVDQKQEAAAAEDLRAALGIKMSSLGAPIESLSGGNQQKVVMARSLASKPTLLLADELTQGVDVGARLDIYEILRSTADSGGTALVLSSDAMELSGLCDRVLVFSRGQVAAELEGDELTEEAITHAVLTSTTTRSVAAATERSRAKRFLSGDYFPAVILGLASLVLGGVAASQNAFYLTAFNLNSLLLLFAAYAFVALAQQLVMMTGGIDLSVGPLAGVVVVAASFVLPASLSSYGGLALGLLIVCAVGLVTGVANWVLIEFTKIPPVIGTLITFTLLQGVSLVLRPEPGGAINGTFLGWLEASVGFVPVAAIAAVALGLGLELAMRRTAWGLKLRAVGSRPAAAKRLGIRIRWTLLTAYVGASTIVVFAALVLMTQTGSGDASAGISFTLPSVTAVVLAGASVFGGRGSFIGALTGALLIQQLNTVTVFLALDEAWQHYLLGGLTILAAGFYSKLRSKA
ncbi:ATP-binding cassette domain-containing protein [Arthrobacter sp. NPDC093128]|uniref:ATP-binding cassette domain-containing protein n=1 Tax=Arthrobacter sp. NPDC093128 TaxID=3154979 RepID=UPI0034156B78